MNNNDDNTAILLTSIIVAASSLALPFILPIVFSLVGQLILRDEGLAMIGALLGFSLGIAGTVMSIQWSMRYYRKNSNKDR
ncbi:hypothetical protein KBB96_09515 [Luteolibacter ambystomatis]|uniref:Uncharacterized protein n=1 Tax=Luteolibacter ambystomatis TaxID=2824561 RepID=A0A975J358_9BACT|nr:hypothetical protein [Luteolibacter ambystomatis]QUE53117.1 hypothetical protein KBB96_09515 [Luteolibacter ambystomatis]